MIKIYELKNMKEKDRLKIVNRSKTNIEKIKKSVEPIINKIKKYGDKVIIDYTKKFDKISLKKSQLKISKKEIKEAYKRTDKRIINIIKKQISYSKKFAEAQLNKIKKQWLIKTEKGVTIGQLTRPIDSVGLYVPGGTAPYPTVMQILGVAAKTAGVKRIAAFTPPRKDMDILLIAADLAGIDEIHRVGGVAAIAAMAYGTETIKKVDKIAGPGNIYVNAAKLAVFGDVAIDMLAGPSEAVILADKTADASFVAADILARAEHDKNAAGVLVTDSKELILKVKEEIKKQLKELKRKEIIKASLAKYSALILAKDIKQAIKFTNEYAPEHLEIITKNPFKVIDKIKNSGSIFLGSYTPVAVGDYASGVNHVLPTCQAAKAFSGVGVETFMKKSEFEYLTKKGLKKLSNIVEVIADIEGFDGHKNSVMVRLNEN